MRLQIFLFASLLILSSCGSGSGSTSRTTGGGGGGGGGGAVTTPPPAGGPGGGDVPPLTPPPSPGGGSGGSGSSVSTSIDPGPADSGVSVSRVAFQAGLSQSGNIDHRISVQNTTSFQIVSRATGALTATVLLLDPARATLLEAGENKTTALFLERNVNSLPYPTRGADPGVIPGTYSQLLYVALESGLVITGEVVAKNDPNLLSGVLPVNLFLVGSNTHSGSTRNAINQAVAIWRSIYQAVGVELDIQVRELRSDSRVIPNPSIGSTYYLNNATGPNVRQLALNMYLADTISLDGTTTPGNPADGVLGIAPSIPGPAVPTVKSAVAISLSAHAGADGVLSQSDTRILGETMAHEAGHYLGLFHPVECDLLGCNPAEVDPLDDTPVCSTINECRALGVASNNMFPVPVAIDVLQQSLTPQQREVMNLQVVVQ